MCGCTVDYLVPTPSSFGQNCLKQNAGCLEKRQHLGPMKHAQTKYVPHLHVSCNKLHTTSALIKKIFSYHSFTHWAWKQEHISLYKVNPTIHFRRQKFPVRHTIKIFCLCRGYPPIRTFCMTNTKNVLAPN